MKRQRLLDPDRDMTDDEAAAIPPPARTVLACLDELRAKEDRAVKSLLLSGRGNDGIFDPDLLDANSLRIVRSKLREKGIRITTRNPADRIQLIPWP